VRNLLSALLGAKPARLSLAALLEASPQLGGQFVWRANRLPTTLPDPLWLHFGCGEHVLDGFLNLDFLPHDARVLEWDLLQPWPDDWPRRAKGAFCEDTLEHFFLAEQLYILCEVNRALEDGATFRVLMPALDRLLEYCRGFQPRRGEFLHETFAVETEADAVNAGMRFSGHRWLHDDRSFAHLARQAGFTATKTDCSVSGEPYLSSRNLRVEEGTAAFAHDLRKVAPVRRLVLAPESPAGFERLEALGEGIELLRVKEAGAALRFRLPRPADAGSLACVNVRSANLTSLREHSLKRFLLGSPAGVGAWALDETLKSRPDVNLLMPAAARLALKGPGELVEVALVPGAPGDLVTAGRAEIFLV
jgi:hypothetical protein